jgi:hypothetical protein
MKFLPASFILAAAAVVVPAQASVVVANTTQVNASFVVSNADLLQTNLASANYSGGFSREGEDGTVAFTNGTFGVSGAQGTVSPTGTEAATADGSNVAIYTFNSGNGLGYNISEIATFAGWDAYRGGQSYVVSYSTVADPMTFLNLATVFNNAGGVPSSLNYSTRAIISATDGFLATNVRSLRFAFGGNLTEGYAGYREIDVLGAAAIPEPAGVALFGLALAGLLGARRKRQ